MFLQLYLYNYVICTIKFSLKVSTTKESRFDLPAG